MNMKLESIRIQNFRSIEASELADCGDFNVLIGKNNSGKSNILSAIDAFFHCVGGGNVVTLEAPFGREIDFFQRKTDSPIEITIFFALSLAERDALIRDIVTDAPQVKTAADGLDPSLRLATTVNIVPPPVAFAFVSELALVGATKASGKPTSKRTILGISSEAGLELHAQLKVSQERRQDAEGVGTMRRTVDRDDWSRFRREDVESERAGPPFSYYLRRSLGRGDVPAVSSRLYSTIDSLFKESSSYDEFQQALSSVGARYSQEAEAAAEEPLKNKIATFAGEQSSVPHYARNLLAAMSSMKILHLTERRRPIGPEEAKRLLKLKVSRGGPQVLQDIQQTVAALLGVQIDAFESGSSARGETVAEMDVDNFLVEVNGSGIREALRLILDFEFERPQILLVEEPEIHLHPALETSMMRYLKRVSSECQMFVTTHSTNFLDTTEMKNVYLVSKQDSTQVQCLDFEEAAAQIPRELGIRLSSVFMFDRLVFVEGPSDEAILREFASTLGINLSQSNVGFVPMGGVRNFAYFATEATLSFLTKRQVKMWFLVDRDEREDADVRRLGDLLGDKGTVKVLKKREIENYLLCPRAVAEFIPLKRALSGARPGADADGPPASEVSSHIHDLADRLKQSAIDKRAVRLLCRPTYPSADRIFGDGEHTASPEQIDGEIGRMIEELETARGSVSKVCSEQSKAVQSEWKTKKLDIVPGALLLDQVCQQYGVRFKKERDGARLASLMNEHEIDDEIKGFLKEAAG